MSINLVKSSTYVWTSAMYANVPDIYADAFHLCHVYAER